MSYCRICGSEKDTRYYPAKRQRLCAYCASDTPKKASREAFDRFYWDSSDNPPEAIKREFYSDYLASTCNLKEYREQTTSYAL